MKLLSEIFVIQHLTGNFEPGQNNNAYLNSINLSDHSLILLKVNGIEYAGMHWKYSLKGSTSNVGFAWWLGWLCISY